MHRASAGFSLIEVLVSIVILSVALLGTAGLTAASLKSTNSSYYRSQATFLADDILERMRANVGQAKGSQYNISGGTPSGSGLARFDCDEWLASLADSLPSGTGEVSVDADGKATITVTWDGGDGTENFFKTYAQL